MHQHSCEKEEHTFGLGGTQRTSLEQNDAENELSNARQQASRVARDETRDREVYRQIGRKSMDGQRLSRPVSEISHGHDQGGLRQKTLKRRTTQFVVSP